jgi:HK97 family phage portal protein
MANFFTKLLRREATPAPVTTQVQQVVIDDGHSIDVNSPTEAMKIAAVYSCVDITASTVAKLPLEYKRWNRAEGVYVDYRESSLFYLLALRPSKWHTAYEFWYAVIAQMRLRGNAYAYISRVGFDVAEIILISPGCCSYNEISDVYQVTDQIHGIVGTYAPDDILHFSNGSINGSRVGQSTISYAASTLGLQVVADRETKSRFASGGKLKAIFTNDTSVKGLGLYSNESLDDGAKEIQRKFRSGDDIVSVPGDGKLYPLSMTSSDMEILGNKKFGIREICRAFRVPPSKIYDDYNHAYNAGETENVGFLTDSIDALLTKIEQEITVKLLGDSPVVLSNYLISFDREKMFTVNSITKADFYTKMLATGVWGVNDIRRKENMPAVEGGDVALISCNVAPLNSTKITGEEKSGQPLLEKNTKE